MNKDKNVALQALKILCLASDNYLKGADELTLSYIAPQINAAKGILQAIIDERFPEETSDPEPNAD